jgi:hypothetical protein
MIEMLDNILQSKQSEKTEPSERRTEQPPISTTAADTAISNSRYSPQPKAEGPQLPTQETSDENIASEEIEVFLEDSLLRQGLDINALEAKVSEKIQNIQTTSPKEWENTQALLRASILFKGESSIELTPKEITKKYLEFLCLYRLAKMQDKKADMALIQKQVINSLSPKIGIPTEPIDRWAKQLVPMELVPESIAQKLSTYRKKSMQKATS